MIFQTWRVAVCVCFLLLISVSIAIAQQSSFEAPPIDYLTAPVNDPIAKLHQQLEEAERELQFDDDHGYLKALLDALQIEVDSQVLVFSKTSLQINRISPRHPRALYFNDEVYVGWCQGGNVIEVAATDPTQGIVFYSLKQERTSRPEFVRDRGECLSCHASSRTQNVPGLFVRSVVADSGGQPLLGHGTHTTDHRSDFKERWGGWYVTGHHGSMNHMGNKTLASEGDAFALEEGSNVDSLESYFDVSNYLADTSDIVALMVLEHQTQMHNAITAAGFDVRTAIYQNQEMNRILKRSANYVSDTTERRIESGAEKVVECLMFQDEFQLESPVVGTSRFAEKFEQSGIKDHRGRSLRELNLQTRLLEYPCSYLIYSPSFDGMPNILRTAVYRRLLDKLKEAGSTAELASLTPDSRQAILEILMDTKPEFRTFVSALALD